MRKELSALCLVLVLVGSLPAIAALDGTMSGVVKDKTGQVLPGVSVAVTGTYLQGSRTAVTKSDGTYFLPNLPPGPGYKVAFSLSGFKSFTRGNLSVNVQADTQVNATMELADVQTEVVVTGETPVVDTTQTNVSLNFTSDYLRKIPVGANNRSYQNVILQAPGVTTSSSGGNPSVMGGNSAENAWLVDGINTTDPVVHKFSFNFNFDAIQEVNFQTSGYNAEYGRASGGLVNVVSKSGGNEFSGSADIRYTSNKFRESGDHFDASTAESRNTPWGLTLGGPILKDRLWFFGNLARNDSYAKPYTDQAVYTSQNPSPEKQRFTGWDSGMKLSFTISPQFNGFVNFTDSQATIPGANTAINVRPEATTTQQQRSTIYNLKLNGLFTSNWLAEFQAGRTESHLQNGPTYTDTSVPAWINLTQGSVTYDNATGYQSSDRNRNQLGVNTTYFLNNAVGNHQFKVGFDADKTFFPSYNWVTGTPSSASYCPSGLACGAYFYFRGFDSAGARVPYLQYVIENQAQTETNTKSYAVYLQDQWRPVPRLTLNLGVRWDRTDYYNNLGDNAISFDKAQPRLSAAYDIMGDGKTVVRANYGTFYLDAAGLLSTYFNTGINAQLVRIYQWSTTSKAWRLVQQTGGYPVTATQTDGTLKPTWDEQFNFAIEREVVKGLAFTATYIYKKTHDIFEDTCSDNEECPGFWLSNYPGRDVGIDNPLNKSYYAYSFQLEYRFDRGLVNGSYVYSKSQGSIDSAVTQYGGGDFDHYPENFVNRYGYMSDDARNRFRVFGSYRIPVIETNLGVNYTYRSGAPYTVTFTDPNGWGTVYAEPRGSSRTPVLHQLDLQLEKQFLLPAVKSSLGISVIGSVYNLFNSQQATGFGSSLDSPSTLRVANTWQLPRRYEIGLRIDF